MIDKEINELTSSFSAFFSVVLKDQNRLSLDYSWPSVGSVDLLLSPLRDKPELSDGELNLVLGASAYLGIIAQSCWEYMGAGGENSSAPPVKADLRYDRTAKEVILTATGGRHLKHGEQFSVRITSTLKQILTAPANPFPCFADFARPLESGAPVVTLFALGLCTGITPYGEGPWKNLSPSEAKEHLLSPEVFLAKSSAGYYQRVFPTEPFGAEPLLYSTQLILPPNGYNERFFGSRAGHHLARVVKDLEASNDQLLVLAQNLALMPSQQIAFAGFLLGVAVTEEQPKSRLRYFGQTLSSFVPLLKPALAMIRKELGKPDPLELIANGDLEVAEKILEIERECGLLPLMRDSLTGDTASTLHLVPKLLPCAYWGSAELAREALDSFAATQTLNPEQILFGIFLDVMAGNFKRAHLELQDKDKNRALARLDHPALQARRDELVGHVATHLNNPQVALPMFLRAAESYAISPRDRAACYTAHAEILLILGKAPEALASLESGLEIYRSLRAETLKLELTFRPNDPEFLTEIERLSKSAPLSRPLFSLLVRAKVHAEAEREADAVAAATRASDKETT